jgi:hypothetical protein
MSHLKIPFSKNSKPSAFFTTPLIDAKQDAVMGNRSIYPQRDTRHKSDPAFIHHYDSNSLFQSSRDLRTGGLRNNETTYLLCPLKGVITRCKTAFSKPLVHTILQ